MWMLADHFTLGRAPWLVPDAGTTPHGGHAGASAIGSTIGRGAMVCLWVAQAGRKSLGARWQRQP